MTRLKQWFAAALVAGAGVWSANAAMTHSAAVVDTRADVLAEILPASCDYALDAEGLLTVKFAAGVSGVQFELPDNLGPIAFDLNGQTLTGAAGAGGSDSTPGGDGAWVFKVGSGTAITVLDSAGSSGRIVGGKGGDGQPAGAGAFAFVDSTGAQFAVTDAQGLVQKGADGAALCVLTVDFGGGVTVSVPVTYGEVPAAIEVPVREGKVFFGVYTAQGGEGTQVFDREGRTSAAWTSDAGATLYALWGDILSETASIGVAVDLREIKPARRNRAETLTASKAGWETAGAASAVNEEGVKVADVESDVVAWIPHETGLRTLTHVTDGAVIETAKFMVEGVFYTVSYNGNGADGGATPAQADCEWGSVYKVAANGYTRTGHAFTGWNDAADGSGAAVAVGAAFSNLVETAGESGTVFTLYAQWKANAYKFVLDGGSFTGEQAVTYGQVPANLPKPPVGGDDVAFAGYFDEGDRMVYDEEGAYVGETPYLIEGDTRLTAKWAEKPEKIEPVSAKQRWPWNGKYDVVYTAEALKAGVSYVVSVDLTVTEAGSDTPVTRSVRVAIPSENGEHALVADFSDVVAGETLDANATVGLRLMIEEE